MTRAYAETVRWVEVGVQQRIAVEQVQADLVVGVGGPALPGLFTGRSGQLIAASWHGVDDAWQVRRARTIVRVAGTVDVLQGEHIPPGGSVVPEQPRGNRPDVRVDHRLTSLPDRPGVIRAKAFDEHDARVALHRIPLAGRLVRPRLKKGTHLQDEGHQARELTKTLGILDAEGADGAFVWTFADPWLTHSTDPRHDLDMTATSLVKTYARGHGSTYPDLPWEPKQAFGAVASFYATR